MSQEKEMLSNSQESARRRLADEFGINAPQEGEVLIVSLFTLALLAEQAGYPFEFVGRKPFDEALSERGPG